MLRFYYSNLSIVKKFSNAIVKQDIETIKKYCHHQCCFTGFKQSIKDRKDLFNLMWMDSNEQLAQKHCCYQKRGSAVIKKVSTFYKIASMLGIKGHVKTEIEYKLKYKKIISVKVVRHAPFFFGDGEELWKNYTSWIVKKYGNLQTDLMNDISLAREYIKLQEMEKRKKMVI